MYFRLGVENTRNNKFGECLHGAEKSDFPAHNLRKAEDFVSRLEVVGYDSSAAAHYGEIRSDLEKKGTPIGVNDLHIAGHARSLSLTLTIMSINRLVVLT